MSDYRAPAYNPTTNTVVEASWMDNWFGPHIYGVRFDGDPKVYRIHEIGIDAAAATISRLTAERDGLKRIEKAARDYYQGYCQDEAAERELCISDEQHERAKELRDALAATPRLSDAVAGGAR